MIQIPLATVADQSLNMTLNRQDVTITIYQRAGFCYMDLGVGADTLVRGQLIVPCAGVIPPAVDFSGQFVLVDTQSIPEEQHTPDYRQFGTRYELFYCDPDEWEDLSARLESMGA